MASVLILCYGIPVMFIVLYQLVRFLLNTIFEEEERTQKPIQIDLDPFWESLNTTFGRMAYGSFSKYQQPITDDEEKRKNDAEEVFDEKRKRLEEDEDDASYWVVGDDGELEERKAKR